MARPVRISTSSPPRHSARSFAMSDQIVIKGELTKGPLSDPDSCFAAINVEDSARVMDGLRGAGVQFDVSVNPNAGEGEALCDVFWFWKQADFAEIQKIIKDALQRK